MFVLYITVAVCCPCGVINDDDNVGDISTSGLDSTLLFPVVYQYRIYLWTLLLSLAWSKTLFTVLDLHSKMSYIFALQAD